MVHSVVRFGRAICVGQAEIMLRNGAIVSMPAAPTTNVEYGPGSMDAYLVEIMATSGMSGGPSFVNLAAPRMDDNYNVQFANGDILLLGRVHGHWIDGKGMHEGATIAVRAQRQIHGMEEVRSSFLLSSTSQRLRRCFHSFG